MHQTGRRQCPAGWNQITVADSQVVDNAPNRVRRLGGLKHMRKSQFAALAAAALLILSPGLMRAGVTTYTSQSVFNSAAGSISTQTFESVAAKVGEPPSAYAYLNNPLNNGTNSGVLTGLTIDATTDLGADLFVGSPDFEGTSYTNYTLFSNQGGGLDLYFSQGASAASVNFLSLFWG